VIDDLAKRGFMAASKKTRNASRRSDGPSEAKLDEMIAEAIVDAYGESEQILGFYTMIEDNLALPFKTEMLGVEVTVERIDLSDDDQIVAIRSRGKTKQRVPLLDLPLPRSVPGGRRLDRGVSTLGKRWELTMSDEPATIDRDKLCAAIRRLGPEYVFYMLEHRSSNACTKPTTSAWISSSGPPCRNSATRRGPTPSWSRKSSRSTCMARLASSSSSKGRRHAAVSSTLAPKLRTK